MDIKNALFVRLNTEVKDTERALYLFKGVFTKSEIQRIALDRGMGIVMFAQDLGVPFKEADALYENFKREIENLVDNN